MNNDNNEISGTFKQGGLSIPLNLKATDSEASIIIRPQTPKKPYPYYSKEVIIQTNDGGYIIAGYSHSKDGDVSAHIGEIGFPDYWIVKLTLTN